MSELITKEFTFKSAEVSDDGEVVAMLTTWENPDVVGDIMSKGCLDEFVQNFNPETKKLPMFFNHNPNQIIGEWKAVELTDEGAVGKGIIYLDVSIGKDTQALLKRKAVASVSIGFRSKDYEKNSIGGRTFKSIELMETSIVANPANPKALVLSVKSEDGFIETKALKELLLDAGLTRFEIDALFNGGWKSLKNLREDSANKEALIEVLSNFKL